MSYPQLLIAVSTTNRVSLLSRVTGLEFWAYTSRPERTRAAISQNRHVEIREILLRENWASGSIDESLRGS